MPEFNNYFIKGDDNTMKWYEKGWVIFLWIIFFFPVGLFLLWKYAHCRNLTKMVITALFIVITPITILPVSENTSTVLGIIAIIIALAAIICYVHKIQKKYENRQKIRRERENINSHKIIDFSHFTDL